MLANTLYLEAHIFRAGPDSSRKESTRWKWRLKEPWLRNAAVRSLTTTRVAMVKETAGWL